MNYWNDIILTTNLLVQLLLWNDNDGHIYFDIFYDKIKLLPYIYIDMDILSNLYLRGTNYVLLDINGNFVTRRGKPKTIYRINEKYGVDIVESNWEEYNVVKYMNDAKTYINQYINENLIKYSDLKIKNVVKFIQGDYLLKPLNWSKIFVGKLFLSNSEIRNNQNIVNICMLQNIFPELLLYLTTVCDEEVIPLPITDLPVIIKKYVSKDICESVKLYISDIDQNVLTLYVGQEGSKNICNKFIEIVNHLIYGLSKKVNKQDVKVYLDCVHCISKTFFASNASNASNASDASNIDISYKFCKSHALLKQGRIELNSVQSLVNYIIELAEIKFYMLKGIKELEAYENSHMDEIFLGIVQYYYVSNLRTSNKLYPISLKSLSDKMISHSKSVDSLDETIRIKYLFLLKFATIGRIVFIPQLSFTNPSNKEIVPSCGESCLMNLFNMLLYNQDSEKIEVTDIPVKYQERPIMKFYMDLLKDFSGDYLTQLDILQKDVNYETFCSLTFNLPNTQYFNKTVEIHTSQENISYVICDMLEIDIQNDLYTLLKMLANEFNRSDIRLSHDTYNNIIEIGIITIKANDGHCESGSIGASNIDYRLNNDIGNHEYIRAEIYTDPFATDDTFDQNVILGDLSRIGRSSYYIQLIVPILSQVNLKLLYDTNVKFHEIGVYTDINDYKRIVTPYMLANFNDEYDLLLRKIKYNILNSVLPPFELSHDSKNLIAERCSKFVEFVNPSKYDCLYLWLCLRHVRKDTTYDRQIYDKMHSEQIIDNTINRRSYNTEYYDIIYSIFNKFSEDSDDYILKYILMSSRTTIHDFCKNFKRNFKKVYNSDIEQHVFTKMTPYINTLLNVLSNKVIEVTDDFDYSLLLLYIDDVNNVNRMSDKTKSKCYTILCVEHNVRLDNITDHYLILSYFTYNISIGSDFDENTIHAPISIRNEIATVVSKLNYKDAKKYIDQLSFLRFNEIIENYLSTRQKVNDD